MFFSYIPVEYEQMIIESLTNREIGQIMNDLYSDDAVDMLEEMPANVVKKVLAATDKETRRDINSLLKYPEDSAGSIMTVEYVDLRAYMSVSDAIDRIRQTGVDKENNQYLLCNRCAKASVRDCNFKRNHFSKKLMRILKDLMTENVITFHTLDDQEEVAKQFQKYDFGAMPVV